MKKIEKGNYILSSEEKTRELGLRIADALEPGDIVALVGDLGVGKTALTKYIAEGLGIKDSIVSPTFTIVRLYEGGRLSLAHFDVYRLSGSEDLWDAGAMGIIGDDCVSVIEWADIVADALPSDALLVHLSYGEKENERIAEVL